MEYCTKCSCLKRREKKKEWGSCLCTEMKISTRFSEKKQNVEIYIDYIILESKGV